MLRRAAFRTLPLSLAGALALLVSAAQAADQPLAPAADRIERPAQETAAAETPAPAPQKAEDEEENTRAVRIIDEKAFPPALPPAPPPVLATPPGGEPPTYEIGNTVLKADNSAGLAIDILPGTDLQAGTRIAFKVVTKRPGYLLLVDVDASGKLTQIYPNQRSLLASRSRDNANRITPGRTVTIPDARDPLAGFEFVASPPNGVAMVVAILSERPVQLIDLPDVPAQFTGRQEALKFLTDFARTLKIAGTDDAGAFQDTKWSFDAKLYVVR
jgi:hypothetical protein